MTSAAVAVAAILLLLVVTSETRRRQTRHRPLDPAGFRRALDAMAPDAERRRRVADDAAPHAPEADGTNAVRPRRDVAGDPEGRDR